MNKVADFGHIYFGRFSVQNIVIFIIFGIIGVLCIYNLTVGKKIRAKASQKNKDIFGALKDKAVEHFGSHKCETMQFVPYMTDGNNGYLLCMSKEKDIMTIISYEDIIDMKYQSKKSCEIIIERDGKYINGIKCVISCADPSVDYTINLAGKKHRAKGFMGKFILSDANELKAYIEGGE